MPLMSTGCKARVMAVYKSNKQYQLALIYTQKKNLAVAKDTYVRDWGASVFLFNNTVRVQKGDTIQINEFYITNKYAPVKGVYEDYICITSWELIDRVDYSSYSNS